MYRLVWPPCNRRQICLPTFSKSVHAVDVAVFFAIIFPIQFLQFKIAIVLRKDIFFDQDQFKLVKSVAILPTLRSKLKVYQSTFAFCWSVSFSNNLKRFIQGPNYHDVCVSVVFQTTLFQHPGYFS